MTLAECQSEPRIAGVNAFQPVVLRRTVRLDPVLAQALDEHCRASGEAPSSVIRTAVRREVIRFKSAELALKHTPFIPTTDAEKPGQPEAAIRAKDDSVCEPKTQPPPGAVAEFPNELEPLCRGLRAFGAESWKERGSRFLSVIALARNCWELSRQSRDAAMLAEFLALAKKFGLLT